MDISISEHFLLSILHSSDFFDIYHTNEVHSWSQFLSKFNSKCLNLKWRVFVPNIIFFATKKKLGRPNRANEEESESTFNDVQNGWTCLWWCLEIRHQTRFLHTQSRTEHVILAAPLHAVSRQGVRKHSPLQC